jgi:hypothetical protein
MAPDPTGVAIRVAREDDIGALAQLRALWIAIVTAADERSYARLVVSPSDEAVPLLRRAGFVMPGDASAGDSLLVRPGLRTPS